MFPTMELRETMRLSPEKLDIKCFVTHAEDEQSKQDKQKRGFVTVYISTMQFHFL